MKLTRLSAIPCSRVDTLPCCDDRRGGWVYSQCDPCRCFTDSSEPYRLHFALSFFEAPSDLDDCVELTILAARIGTSDIGTSEIGTSDIGTSEIGTSEIGSSKLDWGEGNSGEGHWAFTLRMVQAIVGLNLSRSMHAWTDWSMSNQSQTTVAGRCDHSLTTGTLPHSSRRS